MARKFGKKNVIKIDPTAYNVGLIGESGVGKTTLLKEVCEKLVGEDGYLILNIGREDGIDAISNASYEDIPDFKTLIEFSKDVVKNKNTDYKDLKVVVIDTMDELFRITEPYVVELHNKEFADKPDKKVKTIKAAFGGFQAGEDKAIELIIETLWSLRDVGVTPYFIGHTKRKSVNDVTTGEEYETLTSNMMAKYFNSIKTKLHFLGVASIDRSIEKKRIKQKVGADKVVGKVVDESRIITFRDNNFNIDSKSRFSDVIEQIPLDADSFIKALEDAIRVEHEKQGSSKSVEETKVEQEKAQEAKIAEKVEEVNSNAVNEIDEDRNKELINEIKELYKDATDEAKTQSAEYFTERGYSLGAFSETPTVVYEEVVNILS